MHAVQDRDEPPEGPRLGASKRVAGCVFANVAAERQLPSLTGFRLMRRATEVRQAAATMQLTEREWAPDPRQLLVRPPTQLVLPLAGYRSATSRAGAAGRRELVIQWCASYVHS